MMQVAKKTAIRGININNMEVGASLSNNNRSEGTLPAGGHVLVSPHPWH
jgi:hypothetical protein